MAKGPWPWPWIRTPVRRILKMASGPPGQSLVPGCHRCQAPRWEKGLFYASTRDSRPDRPARPVRPRQAPSPAQDAPIGFLPGSRRRAGQGRGPRPGRAHPRRRPGLAPGDHRGTPRRRDPRRLPDRASTSATSSGPGAGTPNWPNTRSCSTTPSPSPAREFSARSSGPTARS